MRTTPAVRLLVVLALLLGTVGCAKDITGTARPDPVRAPLGLSDDGFGVVAGFDDAPAKIEIFTEPQCTHCHDLQHEFGDQIAYYIAVGGVQVTYRPLTFLDEEGQGYSAAVVNAMFAAAEPGGDSTTSGVQFQHFVEELWAQQDPGGPAFSGDELATIARTAGLPEPVVANVAKAREMVDVAALEDANFQALYAADPVNVGTPTVVDLDSGEKVDISDSDWLDQLVAS
ncbi:protein-disulfide isomerase [Mycolicibacterium sp. 018/SC-01/001]|uniref:DsbA family protein n=1 Tax=Mycolicibacterium sp. 018/SC-01/001 TaxID=2592069 RepID=UPI00117F68CC|nr:thioredoxin domain-containing protein [Mycolicibacterium sp. 018/SC-01/001]TRW86324.1 protein-disulfide isomerase [Mycolicibacterium sp. 018/SC-01/001]